MDGREFFDRVGGHEHLEWLGVRQGGPGPDDPEADEVYVGLYPSSQEGPGPGQSFALPVAEILSHEWEELEAVLTGKRQPRVLTHLTRIVGYFSQVHNWNRSKHAELKDRQAGTYVLPTEPLKRPRQREVAEPVPAEAEMSAPAA